MSAPVERTLVGAPATTLGTRALTPSWRTFPSPSQVGNPSHWSQQRGWGSNAVRTGGTPWSRRTQYGIERGGEGGLHAGAGGNGAGAGAELFGVRRGVIEQRPDGSWRFGGLLGGRGRAGAEWMGNGAEAGMEGGMEGELIINPDGTVRGGGDIYGGLDAFAGLWGQPGVRNRRAGGLTGQFQTGYGGPPTATGYSYRY